MMSMQAPEALIDEPPAAGVFRVQAPPTRDLVLDTNVVLDWLAFGHPVGAALEQALTSGRCRWLCTRAMRDELAEVIARDALKRCVIDGPAVLAVFDALGVDTGTPVRLGAAATLRCSDPDDQMFIDLAIARSAHALLTRDRALLRLASRARPRGVLIATPEAWLDRNAGASGADHSSDSIGSSDKIVTPRRCQNVVPGSMS